jgi:hypothetical protein
MSSHPPHLPIQPFVPSHILHFLSKTSSGALLATALWEYGGLIDHTHYPVHVAEADPKDKMITRRRSTNARLGDLFGTIIPLFMDSIERWEINVNAPRVSAPQKPSTLKFRVCAEKGGWKFSNRRWSDKTRYDTLILEAQVYHGMSLSSHHNVPVSDESATPLHILWCLAD